MDDQPELPPFPVDDLTLDMVEASLSHVLTVNEDGDPVPVSPDTVSLWDLCDFLSGTTTDPLGVVEDMGVRPDMFGNAAQWSHDPRPHYRPNDIIRSLINEVRNLREQLS